MRPVLSIIFIDNEQEYNKCTIDAPEMVETILVSSNKYIRSIEKMNYAIMMSSGEYVCIINKGDVLLAGFVDEVLIGIGSNRDSVLFDSVDSNGVVVSYTSMAKRYKYEKDNMVLPIQYFHAIKRRLIQNAMFAPSRNDNDAIVFFSKKITNTVFGEYNIRKQLIKHDII